MYTIEQVNKIIKDSILKNELMLIEKFDKEYFSKIERKFDIKDFEEETIIVSLIELEEHRFEYRKDIQFDVFESNYDRQVESLSENEVLVASDAYCVKTDKCYIFFFVMFKENIK